MKRALALAPFLLLVPAAPALAGGGCHTGGPATLRAGTVVRVDHACFTIPALRVPLGKTVTWDNDSGLDHNISGPGIDPAELPNGGTYTMTFREAGIYPYACTLHPGMSGVVVVGTAALDPEPAVQPVAATRARGGGGSVTPWALAAVATALVAAVVVTTFAKRERGVPVPAR